MIYANPILVITLQTIQETLQLHMCLASRLYQPADLIYIPANRCRVLVVLVPLASLAEYSSDELMNEFENYTGKILT